MLPPEEMQRLSLESLKSILKQRSTNRVRFKDEVLDDGVIRDADEAALADFQMRVQPVTHDDLCFGDTMKVNDYAYVAIQRMRADPMFRPYHKQVRKWAAMRYQKAVTIMNLQDTPGFDVVGDLAVINRDLAVVVRDLCQFLIMASCTIEMEDGRPPPFQSFKEALEVSRQDKSVIALLPLADAYAYTHNAYLEKLAAQKPAVVADRFRYETVEDKKLLFYWWRDLLTYYGTSSMLAAIPNNHQIVVGCINDERKRAAMVEGTIDGIPVVTAVDIGSGYNLVREDYFDTCLSRSHVLQKEKPGDYPNLCGITGHPLTIVGYIEAEIHFAGVTETTRFYVVKEGPYDVLVGREWYDLIGEVTINGTENYIRLNEGKPYELFPPRTGKKWTIRAAETITLQPREPRAIPGVLDKTYPLGTEIYTESGSQLARHGILG